LDLATGPRLLSSGNNSQFATDGSGNRVKIIETSGGSVVCTKQFIWESKRFTASEARDGSGVITSQYFQHGQTLGGAVTKYYYTRDGLNSGREMVDSTGAAQAQYVYDAFGRKTNLLGSIDSDFQYAGYYYHAPSGLSLTANRQYQAVSGRWLSRDPIQERGGVDLYAYVQNNPVNNIDPSGLGETSQWICASSCAAGCSGCKNYYFCFIEC